MPVRGLPVPERLDAEVGSKRETADLVFIHEGASPVALGNAGLIQ
jgi:hypothetical protein